jgi:ABC-type bacteriocin/lantibiotic exporter with double-glycine peptidase domain
MVLAHQNMESTETELVKVAAMEPGGLDPEELARLGQSFGLRAAEQQLDKDSLFELIKEQRFPIVFLHRRPIDQVEVVHAVIPVGLFRQHVSFLDPLQGQRRVTIRKFEQARRLVGQWVVMWERQSRHAVGGESPAD